MNTRLSTARPGRVFPHGSFAAVVLVIAMLMSGHADWREQHATSMADAPAAAPAVWLSDTFAFDLGTASDADVTPADTVGARDE